jgi:Cu/Ag efflux protein CusF
VKYLRSILEKKGSKKMSKQRCARVIALSAVIAVLFLSAALAQNSNAGKKSFTFKGKVEKVDVAAKKITVNGEKVEGWMDSMTMLYAVDKEDVLKKLKVGDQITAKVYEGDFMVLHDVQVVPEARAPASPAKK